MQPHDPPSRATHATVAILEDDLVVGEEQLRHDVGVLPVQPQWTLCRRHYPALLQPGHKGRVSQTHR